MTLNAPSTRLEPLCPGSCARKLQIYGRFIATLMRTNIIKMWTLWQPRSAQPPKDASLRLLYLACVALGGVGTHLISEFAAMGFDADRVVLSPRHLYLAVA